jgi:hypothetical protein
VDVVDGEVDRMGDAATLDDGSPARAVERERHGEDGL